MGEDASLRTSREKMSGKRAKRKFLVAVKRTAILNGDVKGTEKKKAEDYNNVEKI